MIEWKKGGDAPWPDLGKRDKMRWVRPVRNPTQMRHRLFVSAVGLSRDKASDPHKGAIGGTRAFDEGALVFNPGAMFP